MSILNPADISITARYTAATWAALGLPFAGRFTDRRGRALYRASELAARLLPRAYGRQLIDGLLVPRHLYMDEWIRSYKIEQVIEVASGFSPRGLMFAQEGLHYVEVDRPRIIAQKRARCADVARQPEFVAVDATATDFVDHVSARCKPGLRTALVTEGFSPYFSREGYLAVLKNFRALALRYHAVYLTDFYRIPRRSGAQRTAFALGNLILKAVADQVYVYIHDQDELRLLFAQAGWQVQEIASPAQDARYLRGAKPAVTDGLYVVTAAPQPA